MLTEDDGEEREIGRRCASGCLTWPDEGMYMRCPTCGEKTTRYRGVTVADQDEVDEAMFEAVYKRHCARLQQEIDGPLPTTPEEDEYWSEKYPDGAPI